MSLLDTVEYLGSSSFPPSQTYSICSTTEVVGETISRLILKLINRNSTYNNEKKKVYPLGHLSSKNTK